MCSRGTCIFAVLLFYSCYIMYYQIGLNTFLVPEFWQLYFLVPEFQFASQMIPKFWEMTK
jgi:hypothetical protein